MIVLHYTGMPDVEGAIAQLCTAGTEVSAHYIVLEDGRIVQCVPEAKRAWHAGVSAWAGEEDINSCSIGVEIVNRGHDWGYPDFPLRQIAAVIALCRGIMLRRNVPSHRVLAHSDVAPARKKDPGEKFPWHSLANSGVGHWVQPAPIVRGETLKLGIISEEVCDLQQALARYGYGMPITGKYDGPTMDVITAFQRHFRPARVDGIADHSTSPHCKRCCRACRRTRWRRQGQRLTQARVATGLAPPQRPSRPHLRAMLQLGHPPRIEPSQRPELGRCGRRKIGFARRIAAAKPAQQIGAHRGQQTRSRRARRAPSAHRSGRAHAPARPPSTPQPHG